MCSTEKENFDDIKCQAADGEISQSSTEARHTCTAQETRGSADSGDAKDLRSGVYGAETSHQSALLPTEAYVAESSKTGSPYQPSLSEGMMLP